MAGVAVVTPTSLFPHQHFTLLPLLATPKAHICTFNVFGHTIIENDSPPMLKFIYQSLRFVASYMLVFFREAVTQSGAKRPGGGGGSYHHHPVCHGRMRNDLCRRGLNAD